MPPVLPPAKLPPDTRIETLGCGFDPLPANISPRQSIKTCELLSTPVNVNVTLVFQPVPEEV